MTFQAWKNDMQNDMENDLPKFHNFSWPGGTLRIFASYLIQCQIVGPICILSANSDARPVCLSVCLSFSLCILAAIFQVNLG